MRSTLPSPASTSPYRRLVLAAAAALSLGACTDAPPPLAPGAADGPSLASNSSGPLAVVSVVGLEPLEGALSATVAMDINDLGQVAGNSETPSGKRAVVWDNSVYPQDLGTLANATSPQTDAYAINGSGTIVGFGFTSSGERHAVRWVKLNGAYVAQDLGTLGGSTSTAVDIADNGDITGTSTDVNGATHGFLWRNGVMTRTDGLGGPAALNSVGQIVGSRQSSYATVVWTVADGAKEVGVTLGGSENAPSDINGSGEITGFAQTSTLERHAYLWTPRKGTLDLGTLGGPFSSAAAINETGQVVGASLTAADEQHAFLWSKGKMHDLGVLPGYKSSVAFAVNNTGKAVGISMDSESRGTLWTVK